MVHNLPSLSPENTRVFSWELDSETSSFLDDRIEDKEPSVTLNGRAVKYAKALASKKVKFDPNFTFESYNDATMDGHITDAQEGIVEMNRFLSEWDEGEDAPSPESYTSRAAMTKSQFDTTNKQDAAWAKSELRFVQLVCICPKV